MPYELTLYKTKMNRGNRAYSAEALQSILGASPALHLTIANQIVPNTPFAIYAISATFGTQGQDIILEGYDYITFEYGRNGKTQTWYAFIDDIQPLATSLGDLFISHTVDIWAMACIYFMGVSGTFHMNGYLERAHVNDLILSSNSNIAYQDMRNTLAACEVGYNTSLITKNRPRNIPSGKAEEQKYLYIYIANPKEIGFKNLDIQSVEVGNWDDRGSDSYNSFGLLLVYPISSNGYFTICTKDKPSSISGSDLTTWSVDKLTSSAITAMCISSIPPLSDSSNLSGMKTYSGTATYSYFDDGISGISQLNALFTQDQTEASEGLPPYLNWFNFVQGIGVFPYINTDTLNNCSIQKTSVFSDYISNIPKFRTTIYNPIYIGEYLIPPQIGQAPDNYINSSDIKQIITPDLEYIITYLGDNWQYVEGIEKYIITENTSVFASNITLDYWTRLNAKQTSISALKGQYNSVMTPVVSGFTSAGKTVGDIGSSVFSGDIGKFTKYNIFSGIGNKASFIQGIANAIFDFQSASNAAKMSEQQYNSGVTNAGKAINFFGAFFDTPEANVVIFSCENQLNTICRNLHRYGYNTFLSIDEVYNNHKRKYFNYFKGVDIAVSGMPMAWCDEIAEMFNRGVTLWQSDVENYERCNYQANLNW